jgi:arylformamidase
MMPRKPAAYFEAQHDHRSHVSGSADMLARWAAASALVRQQGRGHIGLRYGADARQTLDVFVPDTAFAGGLAPVLVLLPGGGWHGLRGADPAFLAASFTDEGALVVVPDHDACTEVRLEHIAMQLTEAVAWVWRHAADYGGDPSRIVLAGHGGGGHLAAMLSCCDWKRVGRDLPRRLVQGAMSVSGLHDLAPLRRVPSLQAALQLDAAAVRRLSPVHFPAPPAPQTLFSLVGGLESEEMQRQARLLRQAWGARAVPVCESLPGHDHFSVLYDLADPQGRAHHLLRQLLGLRWYSGLV